MSGLSSLNDQQNLTLTQIAYSSNFLADYSGETFEDIYKELDKKLKKGRKQKQFLIFDYKLPKEEQRFYDMMKQFGDNNPFENYTVESTGNNKKTGFGVVCFKDENGNTGFSYRGTDGLFNVKDMWDNIDAYADGHSKQCNEAIEFFKYNKDLSGDNYLFGHSKGGNLAEYVYVRENMHIKKISLYNPQPINPYSLTNEEKQSLQLDKVDVVVSEGDYVWFLGQVPYLNKIRFAKTKFCGLFDKHFYEALKFKSGQIIDGDMPIWQYPVYGLAIDVGVIFQQIDCNYLTIYFAIQYGSEAAQKFVDSTYKKILEAGKTYIKVADEFKECSYKLIDRVDKWYNKTLDTAKNTAYSNPHIVVDTYKLQRYAERLQAVNNRVSKLDSRLDNLYWKVGLKDLWSLMQADMLTGYSWRITRCISYLKDTASDFEKVESELQRSL